MIGSPEVEQVVQSEMAQTGWELLHRRGWEELLKGALPPTLRLPHEEGPSGKLAVQLASASNQLPAWEPSSEAPSKGTCVRSL